MREFVILVLFFLFNLDTTLAQSITSDPLLPQQMPTLQAIGAEMLIAAPTTTPTKIRVGFGFHDTGIKCTHPDLFPNLDLASSINVVGGDVCDDFIGHGTAMAGTAAKRNDIGIAGIWNRPFFMLSDVRRDSQNIPILGTGIYDTKLFRHTLGLPYEIVIMNDSRGGFTSDEFGGAYYVRSLLDSIKEKTLVFFAAGNLDSRLPDRGPDITKWEGKQAETQGCNYVDLPNVVCVGALEPDGSMTSFSYFGKKVSLGAMGDNVPTTCDSDNCPNYPITGYTRVAGTSISSALVAAATAAVTAQFAEEHPEVAITPALIKQAVIEGSCFEPKLLSADPRTFANPLRFCADGVTKWLRRYADGTLNKARENTALKVSGVSDAITGHSNLQAGTYVAIYGSGFSEESYEIPDYARIFYSMGIIHVRAWCNGEEALVGYVSPTQANVILPTGCYKGEGPGVTNRLVIARTNRFGEIIPANAVLAAEGFSLAKAQ